MTVIRRSTSLVRGPAASDRTPGGGALDSPLTWSTRGDISRPQWAGPTRPTSHRAPPAQRAANMEPLMVRHITICLTLARQPLRVFASSEKRAELRAARFGHSLWGVFYIHSLKILGNVTKGEITHKARTSGVHLPCKFGIPTCHGSESAAGRINPLAVRVMKKGLVGRRLMCVFFSKCCCKIRRLSQPKFSIYLVLLVYLLKFCYFISDSF